MKTDNEGENESLNGAPFEGRRGHRKEKQGREPYCRMNANVSSVDDKIDKLATMLNLCVVNVIEVFLSTLPSISIFL